MPKGWVKVCVYSFFNLGAKWGVWSTLRHCRITPGKETRYPLYRRPGVLVWRGAENFITTEIRSPDRRSGRESLYRLHYRGPQKFKIKYKTKNAKLSLRGIEATETLFWSALAASRCSRLAPEQSSRKLWTLWRRKEPRARFGINRGKQVTSNGVSSVWSQNSDISSGSTSWFSFLVQRVSTETQSV